MNKRIFAIAIILFLGIAGAALAVIKLRLESSPQSIALPVSSPQKKGCSCCSGEGENDVERTRRLAFEFYANKYRDGDISVDIKDFGCHIEASIMKGGKVIKRFSITGNTLTEIG